MVYHYTDTQGLLGILSEKQLFASDYRFLNDPLEGEAIQLILQRLMLPNIQKLKCSDDMKREAYKSLSSAMEIVYIASFCEDGDLLSQWRGYTGEHSGYSIGFDKRMLLEMAQSLPHTRFEKCKYLTDDIISDMEDVVTQSFEEDVINRLGDGEIKSWGDLEPHLSNFMDAMETGPLKPRYFMKPSGFEEEKEHRIVQSASSDLKFRSKSTSLIPYKKLDISKIVKEGGIKKIIIGPSVDFDRSIAGVSESLQH